MKKIIISLCLIFVSNAYAGKINDLFNDGVFNVKWGGTLENVKEAHPGGKKFTENGILTYRIIDGRKIAGIERNKEDYIDFLFNSEDRLDSVSILFDPKTEKEINAVFPKLDNVFGSDWFQPNKMNPAIAWPNDGGVLVFYLTTFSGGIYGGKMKTTLFIRKEIDIKASKEELGF